MRHTPGPWKAVSKRKSRRAYYEHGEEIIVGAYNPSFFGIAKVGGPANHNLQNVMRANARLIEQTPELLEACQAIYDILRRDENYKKYADSLKAVIDRAIGEPGG